MAHVGVVDAGVEAVPGRHLLSAGEPVRTRRFPDDAGAHRRGLAHRSREDRGIQPCGGRAVAACRRGHAVGRPRRVGAREWLPAIPAQLRFEARRVRCGAEISTPGHAQFPVALFRARAPGHATGGSARHGAGHAACHGQGRDERPVGRRVSPLLSRRALVCAALRKDALRPGAARHFLPRGLSDHARCLLCRHRPAYLRLRAARHDRQGRRLLLRRRRR